MSKDNKILTGFIFLYFFKFIIINMEIYYCGNIIFIIRACNIISTI
jgi:hypothetical protein